METRITSPVCTSKRALTRLALAAASAVLFAQAATAGVLVVRSSGPSAPTFKPGKALPNDAKVPLRQGDVLVLLAGDSTRTLKGPGTFSLASAAGAKAPAAGAGRRGRFSALRNAGLVPRSPTLWHVDVSQSGKFCLADPSGPTLWRSSAAEAVTLKLAKTDGSAKSVEWPAGQTTLAWPAEVPITPGEEYAVSWTGHDSPTKLKFASLASQPTDLTSVASALIEQSCDNQLNLLIETVPGESEGS